MVFYSFYKKYLINSIQFDNGAGMDEKKKKMVMFLGSLFVVIIFITSYAGSGGSAPSSGGNSSGSRANTTYYPAFGSANAVVAGYSNSTTIRILDPGSDNAIAAMMTAMQDNGLISTYNQIGDTVSVYLNGTSAYGMQLLLANMIAANSVAFSATEYVTLPAGAQLTPAGLQQSVPVTFSSTRYPLERSALDAVNSVVRVSIRAEITYSNGAYVAAGNTTVGAG